MNKSILDLYSDYLICSYTQTPATRLSNLLRGAISHDKITRSLAESIPRSKDLWQLVISSVRTIESSAGVIVVDDSIEEKLYTDENDIVCWHYDHAHGRQVKGINFMTTLYHSPLNGGVSLPVGFQIIAKTDHYIDPKTNKENRRSPTSKNTYYQRLLQSCIKNTIGVSLCFERCLVCLNREYDVCPA